LYGNNHNNKQYCIFSRKGGFPENGVTHYFSNNLIKINDGTHLANNKRETSELPVNEYERKIEHPDPRKKQEKEEVR